jgi:hypothetical protein
MCWAVLRCAVMSCAMFCAAMSCAAVCHAGILWSPGRNRHHSHAQLSFTHTTEQILAEAAAGSTRDFHHRHESSPLLDPSCLLPGLLSSCHKSRGVGFYLHAKLSQLKQGEVERLLQGVDAQDVLFNNEMDIDTVLQFLCRHEVIVTSSYHGVLWATYMNIPVYSVFDFSEKFANLPFALRNYPYYVEGNRSALSTALFVNGSFLREQCIQANVAFYSTYIEPFVSVLKTLAHSAPPLQVASSSSSGWLRMADFDLRAVAVTVGVECAPLHRNHVYDKLASPQYEANLHVQLDAR